MACCGFTVVASVAVQLATNEQTACVRLERAFVHTSCHMSTAAFHAEFGTNAMVVLCGLPPPQRLVHHCH